jgi:hypothetical protein
VNGSKAKLVVGIAEALEDAGNISQIESVVRLVWGWLERAIEHVVVHSQCHLAETIQVILDLIREVVHKGANNGEEDSMNRLVLKVGVGHNVEMTLKSGGDD